MSSFTPDLDFIKDLVQPSSENGRGTRPEPVAQLSSEKSGLKLVFDTNRTQYSLFVCDPKMTLRDQNRASCSIPILEGIPIMELVKLFMGDLAYVAMATRMGQEVRCTSASSDLDPLLILLPTAAAFLEFHEVGVEFHGTRGCANLIS